MVDMQKELYENYMKDYGFVPNLKDSTYPKEWHCYSLTPDVGSGSYWIYYNPDYYILSISDFYYHEDRVVQCNQPDYISLTYYESVSGEELSPYKRLSPSYIKGHIGHGIYKAAYHKKIPLQCINIMLLPDYYKTYLEETYGDDYINPLMAFDSIDGVTSFPELIFVLKQIKNHRPTGMSAKLYYDCKVAEAVSLIIQKTESQSTKISTCFHVSSQDLEHLSTVTAYINDHFGYPITLDYLCTIACMGRTKLKYTFKQVYQCTVAEYIHNKRMSHAEHLLTNTDLNINHISQIVGYKKASCFSGAFKKNTGLLPRDYRKLATSK